MNEPMRKTIIAQMRRGRQQALYKYLPETWSDFRDSRENCQYTVKIERWVNSPKLSDESKAFNGGRLIRMVNNAVSEVNMSGTLWGDKLEGIHPLDEDLREGLWEGNCDVLTPQTDAGIAIEAVVSPMAFFCEHCRKVYCFKSLEEYQAHRFCTEAGCGNRKLTQFRMIYFCECGYATDQHPLVCEKCGADAQIYKKYGSTYDCTCKRCGSEITMRVKCQGGHPKKKEPWLYPQPAMKLTQVLPRSLSMIDLISREKEEQFLRHNYVPSLLTLAAWAGCITYEELERAIGKTKREKLRAEEELFGEDLEELRPLVEEARKEARERLVENWTEERLQAWGEKRPGWREDEEFWRDEAKEEARRRLEEPEGEEALQQWMETILLERCQRDPDRSRLARTALKTLSPEEELKLDAHMKEAIEEVQRGLSGHCGSQVSMVKDPEMLLEYIELRNMKGRMKLEDAGRIAWENERIPAKELYPRCAQALHFADVRSCFKIPVVLCTYGFTRGEGMGQLQALKREDPNRKNIYAVRMQTEGVLFELDRRAVVEWMLKNQFLDTDSDQVPDLSAPDADTSLKYWFLTHFRTDLVKTFTGLVEPFPCCGTDIKLTYYVYRLLHSISHILIRAAAAIGGVGKESLSEYLFPGIPAVLIYVQNSQGFNLGSLRSSFMSSFDQWMEEARSRAERCTFDPICIESDKKACTGCLYLSEVSCQHFNQDLDRSLLVGGRNSGGKRVYGFWEENS